MITLTVELSDPQALALAQLVKRMPLSDLKTNALNEDEAYEMQAALERVRTALADQGFAPR